MDLMIDLETMATSPRAAISQIGVVAFDAFSGTFAGERHWNVLLGSQVTDGVAREIDPSTALWWMKQSEEARAALAEGQKEAEALITAMFEFRAWLRELFGKEGPERVWSHGATFDIVIMDDIRRQLGYPPLWDFRSARDTRTLFDLASVKMLPLLEGETKHHALSDARAQARTVALAYSVLAARS